jgi:hypothetical protein
MSADSTRRFDDPTAAQQRFLSLFLRSEREIFRHVAALVPGFHYHSIVIDGATVCDPARTCLNACSRNPEREFVAATFLKLELLPQPTFHRPGKPLHKARGRKVRFLPNV